MIKYLPISDTFFEGGILHSWVHRHGSEEPPWRAPVLLLFFFLSFSHGVGRGQVATIFHVLLLHVTSKRNAHTA
jgi:hypothetical protein